MENKTRYDLCPNFCGHARWWSEGFFEKMHSISLASKPLEDDDFVIVENEKAIYRIKKSDIKNPQIVEFLKRNKIEVVTE